MKLEEYISDLNQENIEIEALRAYAIKNNVPIMQYDGIETLMGIIKLRNAKNILEVGTAIGYSALKMASINQDIKVTTLERDQNMYDMAITNIKDFSYQKQIDVINIDAIDYETDEQYDLIFIDAAKSQYLKFFNKFKHNLKPDGVIISDNLLFHNHVLSEHIESRNLRQLIKKIKKYNEFLKNNEEFVTHFLPIGDGVAISFKKNVGD